MAAVACTTADVLVMRMASLPTDTPRPSWAVRFTVFTPAPSGTVMRHEFSSSHVTGSESGDPFRRISLTSTQPSPSSTAEAPATEKSAPAFVVMVKPTGGICALIWAST